MQKVFCALDERFVNPLFEVFDGGDFILSSYRDIEEDKAQVQIFFPDSADTEAAKAALASSLGVIAEGNPAFAIPEILVQEVPDEDWKLSYRRHFKTERIGERLVVRPAWEPMPESGVVLTMDPGMSFGTGKHETTRACLEYIDELSPRTPDEKMSMLDMGCGSGILSIAASLLGYSPVAGFDVDADAVAVSRENAALNAVSPEYFRYALGGAKTDENGDSVLATGEAPVKLPECDLVAANILGPLLIRYADEIAPCARRYLVVSGILNELYPKVAETFAARGFKEISRKELGEWTTGLLERTIP